MSGPTNSTVAIGLAQKRALLAARLRQAASEPHQSPLSFAQQRLWFLDQLEPDRPLYNIGSGARIEGEIDIAALERSLNAVIARHETLRARFACPDGVPIQIVDPPHSVELNVVDLSGQSEDLQQKQEQRLVRDELGRGFDLCTDHPLRLTLIKLRSDKYLLLLVVHHIVADEWSLRVFFQELTQFYAGYVSGSAGSPPELPIQYSDYARWQQRRLEGDFLKRQLDYWKQCLNAYPAITELPTDHPRGPMPTFNGRTTSRYLDSSLCDQLAELARQRESTLFMALFAAFNVLIYRYTRQEDLIICLPLAGRSRVETENLIGFFANTLPLRTKLAAELSFEQVLAGVREATLGAMAHQELPFQRLVEELQPERTLTHLPFTKLMFSFQSGIPERIELPGATIKFIDVEPELAKFELTLALRQTSKGLFTSAEYNCDLFEPETIFRFLGHFETLIRGVVNNPKGLISELPMLSEPERHQLLVEWNRTAKVYPRDLCIHELFEERVQRAPDATALVWEHQRMSYGELNFRANQLAAFLKQFEIRPDVPVGLCVDGFLEMAVGMLGILKAGGAYVPLDASYPKERLGFMIEDVGAQVVLTQQCVLERVPHNGSKVLCLDADWELISREPHDNRPGAAKANSLAYIMYTSGSTGKPKGVAIPHRAVSRLVVNNDFIGLDPSDRIAQVSNFSFDAATFEFWGALLNGARVVGIGKDVALSPRDFANELREQGVTSMFLTAALFNQLASEVPGAFASLRTVIVGGEALDPKWVKAVLKDQPPKRLVNGYGPTENTTFTCCHTIDRLGEIALNVPIGKPISNTTIYILDSHLNPVPIGVPGELYAGGDGLARGYWNRPELTAQKFVHNPFDSDGASFLYRTGDLARFLPDGTVEFLGRIDDQVKIRGFRIELGEIESLLSLHPGVRECAVTVCGTSSVEKRLVAHVVPTKLATNASDLRNFLMQKLPDYMIPSSFVQLSALPLTPNGKVDRKALPAPDEVRPKLDRQYVAPRDPIELQLVGIWESVLAVRPIGVQDKFFDLGGHSMLAVRVIAQIEKSFGKKLRLATLFQSPTIERLASVLREETKEGSVSSGTSLVEIQALGTVPPLFLVHGAGGGMFWGYVNLARRLGLSQPVYGFKSRGLDGLEELTSIEEMAASYVADMRKVQAHGPYYLGGYCFGGNVAYEMACQLSEQGETVGLLALLNCAPPSSDYFKIPWSLRWSLKFGRNLLYWADYFSRWSSTQRREFFRWKWQLLKKRLSQRSTGRNRDLSKVEPGDLVDLSSYTKDQRLIWETHIRALMKFQPRPYHGTVHLFRSPGHPLWCSFDEKYGWGVLAQGGVKPNTVAGAHEKILEEPLVKELADKLSAALTQAREIHRPLMCPPFDKALPYGNGKVRATSGNGSNDALASMTPRRTNESRQSNKAVTRLSSPSPAQIESEQLNYWRRQLADMPELLDLPADRARPAENGPAIGYHKFSLDGNLGQAVIRFATERACDVFDVFVSVFAAIIHRYTGHENILIGSLAGGCAGKSCENAAHKNLVALRCALGGDPSFEELAARSVRVRKEAAANSLVPFSKIVEALRSQPSPSYAPIFQLFLSVDRESETGPLVPVTNPVDIGISLVRKGDQFLGFIRYNTALFDEPRMRRLGEHFVTILGNAATAPQQRLSKLKMLPEHERELLLHEWNQTEQEYPMEKTLAQLFCEQASRTPDRQALVYGHTRLSYAEVHTRAVEMARRLNSMGVTNESLVGICLERSVEMVTAILGTLLAGGAYVPLDPKYPKDRIAFTLQDAKVKVLVTQESLLSSLPQTDSVICSVDSKADPIFESSPQPLAAVPRPTDLAYVIYTSGSTGKPKGVAIEHRNAVALVSWARQCFTAEELSGVLASTSICFDLSVFELFVPLCCGGKVILADNALALQGLPAAQDLRLINTVPSAIRELLRLRAVPPGVRVINLAGEPLTSELVDQIYRESCVCKVFDLYGPTETTTYSTGSLRQPGKPATIGRPLSNEQVYVLDARMRLAPIGVAGELFIGGAGVARGYVNRPELTSERFVAHPFKKDARLYRTGDLARWRADGTIEYLGRLDHQVKIRGFRIELGEVEAALKSHPNVAATVAISREDKPGDKRLVAYIVPKSGTSTTEDDLKQHLRAHLPDFMVPSHLVLLAAMPMTPNGKIDRKALPAPEIRSKAQAPDSSASWTLSQGKLASLWREVLHSKDVGINDNFFDLGGDSLLAIQVISGVREIFQVELPVSALFFAPTIESFSQAVDEVIVREGRGNLEPIAPAVRKQEMPVSYTQERLWFLNQVNPQSAAYNVPAALRLKGPLDPYALRTAVESLISRHEALRITYQYSDEGVTQRVARKLVLDIPTVDLRERPAQERESFAQQLVNQTARQPFDLGNGPLIRVTLFRLGEEDHVLLVVLHHSISDGWSLALFFEELGALYEAAAAGMALQPGSPPTIQYVDFAAWQRQRMRGSILESALDYWKAALSGAPPQVDLPMDRPRPKSPSGSASTRDASLSKIAAQRVSEFARQQSCTPFMFFLSSLLITLQKWTGQKDLVLGTVVAGRTRRELERIIGCFMNFLPIRAKLEDADTGRELLGRVRSAVLEAQNHQECPFEKIVEALNPRRMPDLNPLYNVGLLLQNFPQNLLQSEALLVKRFPVSLEAALLDLRFEIEQASEGLSLICEYKTDLFDPETIDGLLVSWLKVTEHLIAAPETPISRFELAPGLRGKKSQSIRNASADTVVVVSSFTSEPVAGPLQYWLRRLQISADLQFAPYNQVFQQLLDPLSMLARNARGLNIVLLRLEDWLSSGASAHASSESIAQALEQGAHDLVEAIKAAAGRGAAPFLVCLCPAPPDSAGPCQAAQVKELRQRLEQDLASISGVYLLTLDELSNWYPVDEYYDPASEALGHVPYTPLFFTSLGTALARKFHALRRPACKVIALDCDNTLWAGICGEDGPDGVRLDEPHRALQDFMHKQRDSGLFLCLCSKNSEEDVRAVFSQRPEFPLQMNHFAACRLNWQAKSANLKSLAQELGLGLDSFIFLDDNPLECAEVQANCPEVLTLQLPEDPNRIVQFLNHCWAFDHLKLTAEDRLRSQLYEQNKLREQLRLAVPSLEAFLSGLQLNIEIKPVVSAELARLAQLSQRTNQFNFTTHRMTEADLIRWLDSGEGLVVRVKDRFGDYGLVGTILYLVSDQSLTVETLLLSCRVLGRGVEHRIVTRLGQIARERGLKWVDFHFVPSSKNKPALNFLEQAVGRFKQPLNGGYVFRVPSDIAASLVFQPAPETVAERAPNPVVKSSPQSGAHPNPGSSWYGEIALRSVDINEIQQAVRAASPKRQREGANYVAPGNDLERNLCQVWQELLPVNPVGVHDDFFQLGGHSLLAVRLFSEIETRTGRKLPLVTIFQAPTIARLARVFARTDDASSLLVPIKPTGDKPPLFLVHGAGGDVLWGYANLAAHISPDRPVYGIRSAGYKGNQTKLSLEVMARSYLEVVRTRQPEGPYYLGGYCFGGNVAYEMARQLKAQGKQVALVVLLDAAPANAGYETVTWWRPSFPWRFARNLRFWLADFLALNAQQRRRFVARKLRWIGRKLGRRLARKSEPEPFDLEEVIDPGNFPPEELNLWQVHLEALIAHVERPYGGRVALLRTRGQPVFCSLESDFCWGRLVQGSVTVRFIPGSHENVFMEPNVRALAKELTRLLEENPGFPTSNTPLHSGSSLNEGISSL